MENANSLANHTGIANANLNSMKLNCSNKRSDAMSLFEVLVVVAILTILIAMLLPTIAPRHDGRQRINCVNNLKEISLAYQLWAGDNGDKYPTFVSVTNGGAMELAAAGNAAAVFQVMSNELSTPRILLCPEDKTHSLATNFENDFSAKNVSYFAGLDATNELNPKLIIAGDDNFLLNGTPIKSGVSAITSNSPFAWDDTRHVSETKTSWFSKSKNGGGNFALGDGSAQQLTQNGLKQIVQQTGLATNRLAIP